MRKKLLCKQCNNGFYSTVDQPYCNKCRSILELSELKKVLLNKGYLEDSLSNERLLEIQKIEIVKITQSAEMYNNFTHKKFWIDRGYSEKDATKEIQKFKKDRPEYWLERGYSEEMSFCNSKKYARSKNPSCNEYWINKGVSDIDEISKNIKEYETRRLQWMNNFDFKTSSRFSKLFWMERGLSESAANKMVLSIQHDIHKHRDMTKYLSKRRNTLRNKPKEEIDAWHKKISNANKRNKLKSPIFIEFWLQKGYSKIKAKEKVREVKYLNKTGSYGSKIETECMDSLQHILNVEIIRNKFMTINNKIIAPDGRINNFIIEFNGTAAHLDPRFYNESDKTPWGVTYKEKHQKDSLRNENILTKFNLIVIWEYDYINNKNNIFTNIKNLIENETIKNGKYWSSSSI